MIQKHWESGHYLTEKVLKAILSAVDPLSPENPWNESSIRERNLLILMLIFFGLRSGEVLQLRINDIDFDGGVVSVSHPSGMKSKTVPLPLHLLDLLHRYLCVWRSATDHDYLFGSQQSGKQMTFQELNRIFRELQKKVPSIPVKLTAYAFRRAVIISYFAGIPHQTIQEAPVTHVSHYPKKGNLPPT